LETIFETYLPSGLAARQAEKTGHRW